MSKRDRRSDAPGENSWLQDDASTGPWLYCNCIQARAPWRALVKYHAGFMEARSLQSLSAPAPLHLVVAQCPCRPPACVVTSSPTLLALRFDVSSKVVLCCSAAVDAPTTAVTLTATALLSSAPISSASFSSTSLVVIVVPPLIAALVAAFIPPLGALLCRPLGRELAFPTSI